MSMGESGVAVALDSTNSMTGTSAHCMARCRIEVPSVRALGSCSDDLPSSPSVGPDWSRIAFDIAAVSPLRSDSNTLNSLTDCSIELDLAVGELGGCSKLVAEGLWLPCPAPVVDMLVERCGLCFLDRVRLCPDVAGLSCEGCELAETAVLGGEVSLPSVVGASVLEATRDRRFFTLADLERLCLRCVVRGASGYYHDTLSRPPHIPRHDASGLGAPTLPWLCDWPTGQGYAGL
jgi:hypothetical protein